MKKLILLLLTAMTLTLITALPAYAESAQPDTVQSENLISINTAFDPENWTFGGMEWLSDIQGELAALDDFECVTVGKSMEDLYVQRNVYIEEFGREFLMNCAYSEHDEKWLLERIILFADIPADEYAQAVDGAEDVFRHMVETCDDIDESYNAHVFDEMRTSDEGAEAMWSSRDPVAKLGETPLHGCMEVSAYPRKGAYRLQYKFGLASLSVAP